MLPDWQLRTTATAAGASVVRTTLLHHRVSPLGTPAQERVRRRIQERVEENLEGTTVEETGEKGAQVGKDASELYPKSQGDAGLVNPSWWV